MSVTEFWNKYFIPICPQLTEWIDGKLITHDYKKAWQIAWDKARQKDRDYMMKLPGFDQSVFEKGTGINVSKIRSN